jgi:RHS repeat-associated protein
VTPTNQVYCYHFNATGSTIAMMDQSQAVVNSYVYDAFGNVTQSETISQPFKYVGQFGVMTEPNGFYYMRARYYDPKVGRFISEDPTGFDGGDVNLYAYVAGNPVMGIDPLGLCAKPAWLDTVETANSLATVGSLALTLAPTGISNVVGAAGLTITGAVDIGLNVYKVANGHEDAVDFGVNMLLNRIGAGAGKIATKLTNTVVRYNSAAARFINESGRFVKTQVGIMGRRIEAAAAGLTSAIGSLYQRLSE